MASKDAKKEPRAHIKLVFTGLRIGKSGKAHQVFRKVLDDGTLEEDDRWYSKIKSVGRPGGIFRMECSVDDDSTVYSATAQYQDLWDDEDLVATWQAKHDAATATDRARKRFQKDTRVNRVFECLEPVRNAYARATGLERQVILAQAVSYITRAK
ncbi:MAG: hypothetical protein ACYTEQ_25820 [Planctomycetota bacterium]